jgi:hypothetical protein
MGRVYMKYQSKKTVLYLILYAFGLVGIAFGAICANEFVCGNYINGIWIIKKLGLDMEFIAINQRLELKNFFNQYIIFVILAWIVGFTAFAVYIDAFIALFRGFLYGYILSGIFIKYKIVGIMVFFIGYIVPALLFLPILFRILYVSIKYSVNKFNYFAVFKETKRYNDINTYILEFIISVLSLFALFVIQIYIINPIIQKIGL